MSMIALHHLRKRSVKRFIWSLNFDGEPTRLRLQTMPACRFPWNRAPRRTREKISRRPIKWVGRKYFRRYRRPALGKFRALRR